MKILNLYSGIGGNRKLWDGHEITAVEIRRDIARVYADNFPGDTLVISDAHKYLLSHFSEFDFIWSSPPCQTHSRARIWNTRAEKKYPDLSLYQEIIFLGNYFNGCWVVENVDPFYKPLIPATKKIGRHLFWSNFNISNSFSLKESDTVGDTFRDWANLHGFDLSVYQMNSRKDQIYRNCVYPGTGLHILNCAIESKIKRQLQLF